MFCGRNVLRNGTLRNEWNAISGKPAMTRNSGVFASGTKAERQPGSFPTPTPPKGGCGVGKTNSPVPSSDQAAWVRENLPVCAAVAAEFKAEFGDVRLVYAAENGHTLGKPGPTGVSLADTSISGSMGKRSAR